MRTIPALLLAFSALLATAAAHADPSSLTPPEDASLLRIPREPQKTQLRITPPAQVSVTVLDGDVALGRFSTQATLGLATGRPYDVVATRGGVPFFHTRIHAHGGALELAWDAEGTPVLRMLPAPPPVVVTVPGPPLPGPGYVPPPPPSMPKASFESMIALLESTSFDSDRLQLIRTAAGRNRFTVEQAGQLLDCLEFSADRLAAVKALKPSLVDPENGHLLAKHFDFSSDKEKVAAIFAR
jgi:hypothetical protein